MEVYPGIAMDAAIRFGKPCIKGTRIDIATVLGSEPNQVPKAIPDHLHRVARYGRGQFDAICPSPHWLVVFSPDTERELVFVVG